jgi:hypothetical protein
MIEYDASIPEDSIEPPIVPHPAENAIVARLQAVAHSVANQAVPENTQVVYGRVEKEWEAYCSHIASRDDPFPTSMNANKVYDFMFYQVFRTKKGQSGHGFDPLDYKDVLDSYQAHYQKKDDDPNYAIPHPVNGLGPSAIQQYRAGLKKIHDSHVATGLTGFGWEFVWNAHSKDLVKMAEQRQARHKKETYEEKADKIFGPCNAVERFDDLEDAFFQKSKSGRYCLQWLRNRFALLFSIAGLLRCETLHKCELSDMMKIMVKKDEDVNPLCVMIMQFGEGKPIFSAVFFTYRISI